MSVNSDEFDYLEYVSFSYTFFKNKLYLFWPYEWNIKLEAQSLLVGL